MRSSSPALSGFGSGAPRPLRRRRSLRGKSCALAAPRLEQLVRGQNLIFPALRLAPSGLTAWDKVQRETLDYP
jgi:hypothetical protein